MYFLSVLPRIGPTPHVASYFALPKDTISFSTYSVIWAIAPQPLCLLHSHAPLLLLSSNPNANPILPFEVSGNAAGAGTFQKFAFRVRRPGSGWDLSGRRRWPLGPTTPLRSSSGATRPASTSPNRPSRCPAQSRLLEGTSRWLLQRRQRKTLLLERIPALGFGTWAWRTGVGLRLVMKRRHLEGRYTVLSVLSRLSACLMM